MAEYIVSARKYRPATFDTVVGQRALTNTLKNAVATRRLAHSYLFCGSRGVGKTSCARIFAKTINCTNPRPDGEACGECESCRQFDAGTSMNIIEMDAASNNGVDDMRRLVEQVMVPPATGRYRVFIIDEVHMLSSAAFNAFLKTLEEPPEHAVFILATTEKQKIIPTILSRCQIYDFSTITISDIVEHLQYVAAQEGITADPAALGLIAEKADGAMRDALSIFDQVAASCAGNITYEGALDNLNMLDYRVYCRLFEAIAEGRVTDTWVMYRDVRQRGFDSHFFLAGIAAFVRSLMVARRDDTLPLLDASAQAAAAMQQLAQRFSPEALLQAMQVLQEADLNYRNASSKQFLVEVTLIKLCQLCSPTGVNATATPGVPIQPVARPVQPVPAPQPAPTPTPTPAPAPSPAPAPARRPAPPRQGPPTLRSLRAQQTEAAAAAPAATKRTEPYTDDDLMRQWREYMVAHPTEMIVTKTMAQCLPVRNADGTGYTMTVLNPGQAETMNNALPDILQYLRDALRNDDLTIAVALHQGELPPSLWSDARVVAHLKETVPAMQQWVDRFGLTL